MRFVNFLLVAALLLSSCRTSRNMAAATTNEVRPTIMASVSATNPSTTTTVTDIAEMATGSQTVSFNLETALEENTKASETVSIIKARKRITSFTEMKAMAHTGEIAMSKKDLKTLDRLEKHYKGNYEQFRADTFEFTDKAKIIGGIGVLGLLLAIITGSAFGWFLFVVAALAFLLRFLNIIAF